MPRPCLIAKAAGNADLKAAFEIHLGETRVHVSRREKVLSFSGTGTGGEKCQGMEGLLKEDQNLIEEEDPEVRDAALIIASRRVEHYKIAGYGSVRAFAGLLELDEAVNILSTTLGEERATDEKLTDLAMTVINVGAAVQECMVSTADGFLDEFAVHDGASTPASTARHPQFLSLYRRGIPLPAPEMQDSGRRQRAVFMRLEDSTFHETALPPAKASNPANKAFISTGKNHYSAWRNFSDFEINKGRQPHEAAFPQYQNPYPE